MRITKDAEERRNEILDAAEGLFRKKGFDGTSISDLLEKVGIARGTLYYHFGSKEEIMDAVIERYGRALIANAESAADPGSGSVYERITNTIISINLSTLVSREQGEEIISYIHMPQNALMQKKLRKIMIQGIAPILADIVRDGIKEQLFDTPYPHECMEMLLAYADTIFDNDMADLTAEQRIGRITAFIHNVERLLGARPGSFLLDPKLFEGEG